MYHYAGNNPVRYTDLDGNFDVCWNQTLGDYNAYTPIKSVNTGNSCADYVVGTLAGSLNLIGAYINIFSNVLGKTYELVNSATLATCGMDLPAISATLMANNLLAPAGIMLGSFNTYMNGLKLTSASNLAKSTITFVQQTINGGAALCGVDNYYNQNRLFWSGWGDAGVSAEKYAKLHGMTTLEMTLNNPPSFLENPKYWNGLNGVSANFAKTAKGDVTALLIPNFSFNYPGANTFKDLEFGILINNPNVNSINLLW